VGLAVVGAEQGLPLPLVVTVASSEMSSSSIAFRVVASVAGGMLNWLSSFATLFLLRKGHYGILTMNLSCAEYSVTPYADVLDDLYNYTESATRILTILTLNNARRLYILKNPHCLILGTEVLAQVALQQSVDAIFHHVMEHPAMMLGAASN
jgi:hypothetical protein